MSILNDFVKRIMTLALVLILTLYTLLPHSPLNMSYASRDSGVFLYSGLRILNGDFPYLDFWDHKPPVIFYINALGLWLGQQSRWGVWYLEFTSIFLAAYLGFRLVQKHFGSVPAIFSMVLWMQSLPSMNFGGNIPTEYTLPLQFFCLWLADDIDQHPKQHLRWFIMGSISTIVFFTKQNAIGISLAILLYFTIKWLKEGDRQKWIKNSMWYLFGSGLVTTGMIIFFLEKGAFSEFWSASFEYNFLYVAPDSEFPDRTGALYGILVFLFLTRSGLAFCSLVGYAGSLYWFTRFKNNSTKKWIPLVSIGLINLPLEALFVGVSNRFYNHYYMTMLPALALFSGVFVWTLILPMQKRKLPKSFINVLALFGIITIFIFSNNDYKEHIKKSAQLGNGELIEYVQTVTTSNDLVLVWGAQAEVNFFTKRKSPTRFVYQYPLYIQGYTSEEKILEFLEDIVESKPTLIIDTKNPFTPLYDFPIRTRNINYYIEWLKSNYQMDKTINDWVIYKRMENQP